MIKKQSIIIACISIIMLVSWTPSASAVETAIANTQEAMPTFTVTPAPTKTTTNTATPTNIPIPTATRTPEPEVGDIPGLSRNSFVNGILVGFLGLNCKDNEISTTCTSLQFDNSLCSSINVTILGKSETTVDFIFILVTSLPTVESHENCQDVLGLLSSIAYLDSTPEIAQSWVLKNLEGLGPNSEESFDVEKAFADVNFRLQYAGANSDGSGLYSLLIE